MESVQHISHLELSNWFTHMDFTVRLSFVNVNKISQSFIWSGLLNFKHSLMLMSYMSLVRLVIYLDIITARNYSFASNS